MTRREEGQAGDCDQRLPGPRVAAGSSRAQRCHLFPQAWKQDPHVLSRPALATEWPTVACRSNTPAGKHVCFFSRPKPRSVTSPPHNHAHTPQLHTTPLLFSEHSPAPSFNAVLPICQMRGLRPGLVQRLTQGHMVGGLSSQPALHQTEVSIWKAMKDSRPFSQGLS